jgi:hypothetical protein
MCFTNTGNEPNRDFSFSNTFTKFIPYTIGKSDNDNFCILNADVDIFAFRQNGIYNINAQNGLKSIITNITNNNSITCTYGRKIIAPGTGVSNSEVTIVKPINYSNSNDTYNSISNNFKENSIYSASNMRMYNRFQVRVPLPPNSLANFTILTSNDPETGGEFTSAPKIHY